MRRKTMSTFRDVTSAELDRVEGGAVGMSNQQLLDEGGVVVGEHDAESNGITRAGLKRKWTPPVIDISPFDGPRLGG
jgi:hypothetical protein